MTDFAASVMRYHSTALTLMVTLSRVMVSCCSAETVRFRLENDVQLLRVKPATCSLQETIFTNADGQILGKKPSPVGVMKGLKLEPGTNYYIGDFHGTMQVTGGYTIHQEWHIDSAYDRFVTTTEALKARYPAFADLPTLDVMTPASH